jgi:hypothetical protein
MTTALRRLLDSRAATLRMVTRLHRRCDEVLRQLDKQAKRELRQAHRAHKKKRAVETNKAWANGHGTHTAYHALKDLHAEGKQDPYTRCMTNQDSCRQRHRQAQGDAALQSHATPSQTGAHADPAVAAHHAKIEQGTDTSGRRTRQNGTTGPSPGKGRRSNQELKDTKQQATMAALQNSSKWEATTYVAWSEPVQPGLDIRQVPAAWRKGNVTSIFKGGSMDATQCNSYRPITVLPVIDKLFAAVLTGH